MRKVCPHCGREVAVTPQEQALLGKDITTIKRGTGCAHCNGTGYRGRIAVHEIVAIDRNIRRMIAAAPKPRRSRPTRRNSRACAA